MREEDPRGRAAAVEGELGGRWTGAALAAICLAALGLLALATSRGPAATPDSAVYMSAAQNLAQGKGLRDFTGEPLTVFPPVVPAVWALGMALGDARSATVLVVNGLALLACILLAYRASLLLAGSRRLALLAAAVVALAPQTWEVFPMAWSDPFYAAIVMATLWWLGRAPPSERDWGRLGGAAAACALAFLVRYLGLSLLLAVGLWIWWSPGERRLRAAMRFGALALLVPVGWMARNLAIDGTLMGPRPWAAETLGGALSSLGSVAGGWFVPLPLGKVARGAVTLVAAAVVAWGVLRRRRAWTSEGARTHLLRALCIYVLTGTAYVLLAAVVIAIDPIDPRLLSALFAPAVVLAMVAARGHLDALRSRGAGAGSMRIAGAVALLWLAGAATFSVQGSLERARTGRSLSTRAVAHSDFAQALRELPRDQPWFSNHPRLTWWLTRHVPIHWTPRRKKYRSADTVDDFPAFRRRVGEQERILVWWLPAPEQMCPLEELAERGYRLGRPRAFDHGMLLDLEAPGP